MANTNVYQGRTTVSELKQLIRRLGGTPRGNTKAALQDELEDLVGSGGLDPEEVRRLVVDTVTDQLPSAIDEAIETGGLTDEDFDDIFGE